MNLAGRCLRNTTISINLKCLAEIFTIKSKENISNMLQHCCLKRFSSIKNFIDFAGLKRCKNAFFDFDPSLSN
jgi:hypothetical protein